MTAIPSDCGHTPTAGGQIPPLRRLYLALERSQVRLEQLRDQSSQDAHVDLRGELHQIIEEAAAALHAVLVGAGEPRRVPVRISELMERIVHAHDPSGTRVRLEVPSLVMKLDEHRLEWLVDTLLIDALTDSRSLLTLRVTLAEAGMSLTLAIEGLAAGSTFSPSAVERASSLAIEEGGHLQIDDHDPATVHLWLPSIA